MLSLCKDWKSLVLNALTTTKIIFKNKLLVKFQLKQSTFISKCMYLLNDFPGTLRPHLRQCTFSYFHADNLLLNEQILQRFLAEHVC